MKILEVTFEEPSEKSGGGIGIIQSIESLQLCGDVDYVGPEFTTKSVRLTGKKMYLSYSKKFTDRMKSLLAGITNGYYQSWKKIEEDIVWELYDLVSVEFTRYPFVVKAAKKHNIPVVIRIHNVEKDYFHNLFVTQKSIARKMQEIFYSKQEEKSIKIADALIALTKEDKERMIELYGESYRNNIVINPVCIRDRGNNASADRRSVLITGSLWYGPNAEGVIWFLKNVWSIFAEQFDVPLQIAGSKPNEEIRCLSRLYRNVELVENPEDMVSFFEHALCYIAPIFSGAGMKVKIAEAMMHGVPIIATEHALIGYEYNEATKKFEGAYELIEYMKEIVTMSKTDIDNLSDKQRNNYIANYSITSSALNYKKLIDRILNNR